MGVSMSRPSSRCCCGCSDCGISHLLRMIRNAGVYLQWKIDSIETDRAVLEGEPSTKIVKGVVTSCGSDYGWFEECVFFSTDVVVSHLPVQAGDNALAFVEEDPLSHDLKATEVCILCRDDWPRDPDFKIQDITACVSQVTKDIVYLADKYYFFMDSISKAILGFTPFKGDWLDMEYSKKRGSAKLIIHSLKARKRRHLDEVCVTSIHKKEGVLNHTIFFTTDFLKCPMGYTPLVGHVVNVVMIQSIRPNYSWRAISMTPVDMSKIQTPEKIA